MKVLFLAILFSFSITPTLMAQLHTRPVERILIPFWIETPIEGAFGSRWVTEVAVLNTAGEWVYVGGYDEGCRLSACLPSLTPPGVTFYPWTWTSDRKGGYLSVEPATQASKIAVHLRARDLSRQANDWGAEVPTIAESEAPTGAFALINIPTSPVNRLMLRLYYLEAQETPSLRVRFYLAPSGVRIPQFGPAPPDRLVAEEVVTLSDSYWSDPGYAELTGFLERHPELRSADRIRIDVEAVTEGARIWGLLSVTNNDTQHVTYITPRASASPRAGVVEPLCQRPAPLGGVETRPEIVDPDEYIVTFKEGVNLDSEAARLAQTYAFRVSSLITIVRGFTAVLRSETAALLRCEKSVAAVTFSRTNIPPP